MKPILRKVTPHPDYSFTVRRDIGKNMRSSWHYHPEFELLLIKRSSGVWAVGDYTGRFKSGDILLIGPNLPHSFRNEWQPAEQTQQKAGEAVVVLFLKNIFGSSIFHLPEVKAVATLLARAVRGIRIREPIRQEVAKIIEEMPSTTPGQKLINLLSALNIIAESREYVTLSSPSFVQPAFEPDSERLNLVFEHTYKHYRDTVDLDDVANLLNMSKHSFCRYFKKKTRKTYIRFLTEVRIGQACRLLLEKDMSIAEVGYACGYNHISHFYQQFKTITGKIPGDYKKEHKT